MSSVQQVEVAIIGAGLSGLAMALALQQDGQQDFVVLERAERPGGTWWHHRYPGAACDVHAHLYQLGLWPKADWRRAYAGRDEILQYLHDCVAAVGLGPRLQCGAEMVGGDWDAATGRWLLRLRGRPAVAARVLLLSAAPLHRPRLPEIPGLGHFAGDLVHTARWDPGVAVDGRRVGVIGTAASAAQVVPALAARAATLTVFQRSPNWLLPRWDFPYPAPLRRAFAWAPLGRTHRRLLMAGYEALHAGFEPGTRIAGAFTRLCLWHLHRQVPDPALRRALTPDYPLGCKRVLVSSDYYPALQRPNVQLETTPVAAADAAGLRGVDGRRWGLDLLVCATGFHDPRGAPVLGLLRGAEGRSLAEAWSNGIRAHLGLAVPGFPNLFLLYGPNTQSGHVPAPCFIEAQAGFVVRALRAMSDRDAASMSVRRDRMDAWDASLQARLAGAVWSAGCRNWYLDGHGRNHAIWPDRFSAYARALRRSGFDDYDFHPRPHHDRSIR